ncbi:alanine racemase, partial [Sulfurimonas sp. MAG313]
ETEALEIKEYFDYILILSPESSCRFLHNFVYTINSLESIIKFPSNCRVELKIDTGMHRNGINMHELSEAMTRIKKSSLNLEAIFTHYRSADTMNSEWFWQSKNFEAIKRSYPHLRTHSCNSAAIFRENNFNEDMVRIGIAAYGCLKMDKGFNETGLQPVLSLIATKISSRTLQKGQSIGYNASFEAKEEMRVSNYDIGYSDGFPRMLSNVFISPDKFKLLGHVSMDNSSYACTDDELLIFNDANTIASEANTIAYEILTSLSVSLKRKIL